MKDGYDTRDMENYGLAMNHRLGRQDRSICIYECYGIYVNGI
jgi:hypothetical protein